MAGVNLQLRYAHSIAQFVPTLSSPPPPPHTQRVRFGTSPSRFIFCNLRANSAAAPTLRTTRCSETIAASSVSSSVDSNSLVEDRDDVSRIPLLEVRDLRAVIAESRQEILKGVNLVVYEGEVCINNWSFIGWLEISSPESFPGIEIVLSSDKFWVLKCHKK